MKIVAGFFVLLLISGISVASAASIISIELDSNTLVAGEIVEINGTVENSLAGKPVGIEVKDSDGDIILIRAITSDSNGNFTLKFKVPASASGNIEIMSSVEIDGQSFSKSVSAIVSEAEVAAEVEAEVEAKAKIAAAEAVAKAKIAAAEAAGCSKGTILVNGVCEAPKASGMSIDPLYIIIGVVAIGGVIGAIAVTKRGSKTPKPVKEEPKPVKQKPKEEDPKEEPKEEEIFGFCTKCGVKLKPEAKFCGKCGNQV